MSGMNERIRALCAAFDRTESPEILREIRELEFQKRKAEDDAERERREARKVCEAEAKQQAPANWVAWYAAIDQRIKFWFDHYFDGLGAGNDQRGVYADEIAKGLAGIRDELRDELERAAEEQQRAFEAKLAALEGRQDQATLGSWVDNRIKAVLATDGARGREQLRAEFRQALVETVDGVAANLAALEVRLKATAGTLPTVRTYHPDTVHYAGHVVAHQGATYQALRDTARAPPHDDWVCLASAGRDGQSVRVRGAFNTTANYKRVDIVSFDGTAFIARCDNPGVPGISEDGWQILGRPGRRGATGETGARGARGATGPRGDAAPTIVSWTVDRTRYRAIPT